MCEFCLEHGEGKKWYLQMKNYASVLLYEPLSPSEQAVVAAKTRFEWNDRFIREFVLPAMQAVSGGQPPAKYETPGLAEEVDAFNWEDFEARRRFEHFGQVLPIEDVEKVIDIVDSITRIPCGCRFLTTGKTDKRYCFGLGVDVRGILGKYPEAASSLEVLDKEQAKQIFRKYDREGLMHSIWTGVTPFTMGLCNCDRDCGAYKMSIEQRGRPTFFRAEYICQVNWEQCNGCKVCISQCQFGAQFYSSALGKVYIDPTRCYGCGVCRAACHHDAITLVPRESSPEAANLWLR